MFYFINQGDNIDIKEKKNNDRVLLKDGIKEGKIRVNTPLASASFEVTKDMTKLSNTVVTVKFKNWGDQLYLMMINCLMIETDDNRHYVIPFSFVKEKVREYQCKYKVGQKVLIKISKNSGYTFDDKSRVVPAIIVNIDKDTIYFRVNGYNHDGVIEEVRKDNGLSNELLMTWGYTNKTASVVKVIEDGDNNANKK